MGTLVRLHRQAAGHSMEALARLADIAYSTLSELERGISTADTLTLIKIADVLGISLDTLMVAPVRKTKRER